jgi:hypothetical protein
MSEEIRKVVEKWNEFVMYLDSARETFNESVEMLGRMNVQSAPLKFQTMTRYLKRGKFEIKIGRILAAARTYGGIGGMFVDIPGTEQDLEPGDEGIEQPLRPTKRGPGRPKGSKNKRKENE